MVKLTKIYTKSGDNGVTSLGDASRVPKIHEIFEGISIIDELNSYVGVVLIYINNHEVQQLLLQIQNDLFDLGAELSNPRTDKKIFITNDLIEQIENQIDHFNAHLPKLNSFILPSGSSASAHLHVVRTIARKAERIIWKLVEYSNYEISKSIAVYLNRLSDLFFVLARYENRSCEERLWKPKT